MMAGADTIKTSTGKMAVNATFPVALFMLRAIRDYFRCTGYRVGFEPAGGIRSAKTWRQVKFVVASQGLICVMWRWRSSKQSQLLDLSLFVHLPNQYFSLLSCNQSHIVLPAFPKHTCSCAVPMQLSFECCGSLAHTKKTHTFTYTQILTGYAVHRSFVIQPARTVLLMTFRPNILQCSSERLCVEVFFAEKYRCCVGYFDSVLIKPQNVWLKF